MEYNINADVISVKASTVVTLNDYFVLITQEKPIDLKVEIKADFGEIPQEYHEVFLNMLTSKYLNKVSFGHNPFSKCNPPVNKKWYHSNKKHKISKV
jgi:hypothetical protein